MIKNLKTKKRISDAFLKEMQNNSLSNISINTLSDEAEVSRSTFYRLFDSIPKLIKFTNEYVNYDVFNNFTNLSKETNSLDEWVLILVTELYKCRTRLKIMYTSDLRSEWLTYLDNKYRNWEKENLFKNYHSAIIPKPMAIQIFTQSVSSVIEYWISSNSPARPKIFQKQLLDLLKTKPLNIPTL
ncbi:TetR/AcrR family transcriptional regulator [Fructilactobacillus sp. Tb1]|uniref:TetR/AcrR family transcriptional regulator n=1 Tax=Fructilactobacillus sp. Tb1 TaxID=3422304 RepID=UPI003D283CA9